MTHNNHMNDDQLTDGFIYYPITKTDMTLQVDYFFEGKRIKHK